MRGLPAKGRKFFFGSRMEPPRAGMNAIIMAEKRGMAPLY
jgi:hypothetical protein